MKTNISDYESAVERAARRYVDRVRGEDAPVWEEDEAIVRTVFAAIGFGPDSVIVPREANDRMAYVGGSEFEEGLFANEKHVFDAAKDVWRAMVLAARPEPQP